MPPTVFAPEQVIAVVRDCLPEGLHQIGLSEPYFGGREWEYVKECIDTGWVSSVGSYVDRIEDMLAEITGARRAVATVNGTAALHAAITLAGVRSGDEVLVPALTFVATANAVSYLGAVPHFVDSEMRTLGVDSQKLSAYLREIADVDGGRCVNRLTGNAIGALIITHLFGHPADVAGVISSCDELGLPLIEDAAEALGSLQGGQHVGHRGVMGTLSFNGNKTVTTGGGGAILCDDEELGDRAKHMTTTARVPHPWRFDHDEVGFNYRMPNINAALGCAQLEQLPRFIEAKRVLADRYRQRFEDCEWAHFVTEPDGARSNYWLNAILLAPEIADRRDDVLDHASREGVALRPVWTLMPDLVMYRDCPAMDLECARDLERRIINLPSSQGLVLDHE